MGDRRRRGLSLRARPSDRFPSLRKIHEGLRDHETRLTDALARSEASLRSERLYNNRVSSRGLYRGDGSVPPLSLIIQCVCSVSNQVRRERDEAQKNLAAAKENADELRAEADRLRGDLEDSGKKLKELQRMKNMDL